MLGRPKPDGIGFALPANCRNMSSLTSTLERSDGAASLRRRERLRIDRRADPIAFDWRKGG
jgi:hypothetical protein